MQRFKNTKNSFLVQLSLLELRKGKTKKCKKLSYPELAAYDKLKTGCI